MMASITSNVPDDTFVRLMGEALEAQVRANLKAPLMKQAEQMVDSAVDDAVVMLKPRLTSWLDQRNQSLEVSILVERVGEQPKRDS